MATGRIDYQRALNQEQVSVVMDGDGPVLVLAGAGSGKTRTITYRVAYLLEQGVLPQEILLLTFTNKAAREMLSRVEGLVGAGVRGMWGGTFHSVAARLLRMFASEAGYTRAFTILDQEDQRTLMKVCLKELAVDTTAKRFPSPTKLCALFSFARNANQPLRDLIAKRHPHLAGEVGVIERAAEVYELHKRQADAMDFDDLLITLRRLLTEQPAIQERLSSQFRYVLVDEYQDTNVVQADLIRLLCNVHRNILVVGDDAQSIYSFRAAQLQNILRFPETYPGAKTFRLTTNYRSTPQILNVANESIRNNADQFKKTLTAVAADQERPQVVPLPGAPQEARYIASRVLELIEQGAAMGEIAVLFRAAFHSQALEFELMKQNIPYEYRGGLKFFERAHVKDVIAHLRIRANPKDEAAWIRVLGLQQGIGLATAQKIIVGVRKAEHLREVCQADVSAGKRAATGWASLCSTLSKLAQEEHPSDLIRTVMAGDYRSYLEAEYPDFIDRLEDLEQFALFAESSGDLENFLQDVSLTDDFGAVRERGAPQGERIVLSTIHQAKGLEWNTVFVMHMVDGKFPNPRAFEEEGGLEEERRLFYVATTRARRRLIFSYPLTSGYETVLLQQPSLFLQELPDALFERVRVKPSSPVSSNNGEERTIVFDELGETVPSSPSPVRSFLRNIEDL
ncbi:ATP-dependent helicase [Candidatus Parcubacteria bacterium]|nr:ATP-dependent helicase [Candidatus Parcubacteria bacterium]